MILIASKLITQSLIGPHSKSSSRC